MTERAALYRRLAETLSNADDVDTVLELSKQLDDLARLQFPMQVERINPHDDQQWLKQTLNNAYKLQRMPPNNRSTISGSTLRRVEFARERRRYCQRPVITASAGSPFPDEAKMPPLHFRCLRCSHIFVIPKTAGSSQFPHARELRNGP